MFQKASWICYGVDLGSQAFAGCYFVIAQVSDVDHLLKPNTVAAEVVFDQGLAPAFEIHLESRFLRVGAVEVFVGGVRDFTVGTFARIRRVFVHL